jgi:hypothetical protein
MEFWNFYSHEPGVLSVVTPTKCRENINFRKCFTCGARDQYHVVLFNLSSELSIIYIKANEGS